MSTRNLLSGLSEKFRKLRSLINDHAGKVSTSVAAILMLSGCGGGGGGGGSSGPNNPNNAPTATSHATVAAVEDTPSTVTVGSLKTHLVDADNDALTLVSITPTTTHGGTVTLSVDGTTVTIATPENFYGADYASARFTDNHGGIVDLPIDINVANTADAPSAPDLNLAAVAESATNAPTTYILTQDVILGGATSPDGGDLHVYQVTDPTNGGVTTANVDGSFTITMPAYWDGATSVIADIYETIPAPAGIGANVSAKVGTLLAWMPRKDESGLMSDASPDALAHDVSTYVNQSRLGRRINLTVNHANHSPTGNNAVLALDPALFTLAKTINVRTACAVSDPDTARHGDTVALSILANGANGTATIVGNNLTYAPAAGKSGTDQVVIRLTDSVLPNPGTRDVTIDVTGIDTMPPALSNPSYSTAAWTKNDVTVTITSDKIFTAPATWNYALVAGVPTYTHLATANGNGTFDTVDAAGAPVTKAWAVTNIDKVVPAVSVPTYHLNADNTNDVTIAIAVDHAYKQPVTVTAGWTLSAPIAIGGQFLYTATKTYVADSAVGETFTATDDLGLASSQPVTVDIPTIKVTQDFTALTTKGLAGVGSLTLNENVVGAVTVKFIDQSTGLQAATGSIARVADANLKKIALNWTAPTCDDVAVEITVNGVIITTDPFPLF